MSSGVVWLSVVVVVALCGALAWFFFMRGKAGVEPEAPSQPADDAPAEAVVVPIAVEEPVAKLEPVASPVVPPPVAPPPPTPGPAASRPPPAPVPVPVPARPVPPLVVAPPWVAPPIAPRPPAVVVERVLVLESADTADWDAALPLTLLPAQTAAVIAAVAGHAGTGTGSPQAITFEAGAATAIARGDLPTMRALAASHAAASRPVGAWLDSSAATALAATALAALATDRFLSGLGDEVRELKGLVAALPAKLATQAAATVKSLVQDLSRFTRDARDNYASAIGKAAFRERVGATEERAVELWREAVARTDGLRQQMEALAALSRFGEVQVEKALGLCRELQEHKRLQEIVARALAGARLLRISIGDVPGRGAGDPLVSAIAALQGGLEQDQEIAARLAASERGAKGDPYVGKAEFEANRASLRKLLERSGDASMQAAIGRLDQARAAMPLDAAGDRPRCLLIGPATGDAAPGLRWLERT